MSFLSPQKPFHSGTQNWCTQVGTCSHTRTPYLDTNTPGTLLQKELMVCGVTSPFNTRLCCFQTIINQVDCSVNWHSFCRIVLLTKNYILTLQVLEEIDSCWLRNLFTHSSSNAAMNRLTETLTNTKKEKARDILFDLSQSWYTIQIGF